MKNIKIFRNALVPVLISLTLFNCTGNPFFDDKVKSSDGMTLKGKVSLSEEDSKDGVYIWLQDLDVGTYTNPAGDFELLLPHPDLQPGGGYNGISSLFYYLGNYKIDSFSIEIINGKFSYGSNDVNTKGKITKTISLTKLAQITTSVFPDTVNLNHKDTIEVTVELIPRPLTTLHILSFSILKEDQPLDGFFIKHKNDQNRDAVFIKNPSNRTLKLFELRTSLLRTTKISANSIFTKTGEYEIIPYIKIHQPSVPLGLFASLDENPDIYDYTFLNLPFKRSGGSVTVIGP